jgi:hypothetical protein
VSIIFLFLAHDTFYPRLWANIENYVFYFFATTKGKFQADAILFFIFYFPLPKLSRASLDTCIQTPKEKEKLICL